MRISERMRRSGASGFSRIHTFDSISAIAHLLGLDEIEEASLLLPGQDLARVRLEVVGEGTH